MAQEQEEEEGRGEEGGRGEELTSREEQWQEPSSPSFRLEYLGGGSWNRVCKQGPNFLSFKGTQA